ncbi:MAG: 50S ribosomal protein L23 [Candidatus Sigynarchaeota archaeon]
MDPTEILIRPVITESTFNLIENENKLVFIVDKKANKKMIKGAIEKMYSVKCRKINTVITPRGEKKAFIRLDPANPASEVANKMGIF